MRLEKVEPMNIDQAKQSILQAMKLYFCKQEDGRYMMERHHARPLCLMGPTGIGKTEIIHQAAEEAGIPVLSYSVTHHTRQSLIGLPRLAEQEVNGEKVFVTEYTMSEIISEIYEMMKTTGKQEGILFLDEFNCASQSVWPIMLQLLQQKTLGSHAIPDGWMLILAGNPAGDYAGAAELDAVIADRMRMIWVEPDYAVWREYVQKKGLHPVVVSYLDSHREYFYFCRNSFFSTEAVTARGWEDLSVMLCKMEERGYPVELPMIDQYLHDGEVVRSFYTYYYRYQQFAASGIQDKILCGDRGASELLQQLSFEQKWGLMAVLMETLHTMAAEVMEQEEAARVLLWVLRRARVECGLKNDQESLRMNLFSNHDIVRNRKAKEVLLQWSEQVSEEPGDWKMLQRSFQDEIVKPMQKAKQEVAECLCHVIHAFCESQMDNHHLQHMFNELAEDEEILQVALQCDVPEMKRLFQEISFYTSDETLQIYMEIQKEKKKQKTKSA